ncbi:hypothetical protein B0H11DRAFT_1901440 [Mycena galericulata]|nr:hypothetical protein B0H11DRAFT_1901440 [Mycena galericulata]
MVLTKWAKSMTGLLNGYSLSQWVVYEPQSDVFGLLFYLILSTYLIGVQHGMPKNGGWRELHQNMVHFLGCLTLRGFGDRRLCAVFKFTDFARFDDRGLCAEFDLCDCAFGRIRAIQVGRMTMGTLVLKLVLIMPQEKSTTPPQVENIIRSQIFMWVADSSLRSKIRGVVFVAKCVHIYNRSNLRQNNVRDIRRRWPIVETEEVKIDLATGHHVVGTAGLRGDQEDGGFSLSAIPVEQREYRPDLESDSTKKSSTLQRMQAPLKKWLKIKRTAPPVFKKAKEADPSLVMYKICPYGAEVWWGGSGFAGSRGGGVVPFRFYAADRMRVQNKGRRFISNQTHAS